MTYMWSWKSLRLTSHTWLGLNPQIGRPLSRIVVPLVYFFLSFRAKDTTSLHTLRLKKNFHSRDIYQNPHIKSEIKKFNFFLLIIKCQMMALQKKNNVKIKK
jgi:ribosomal protein L30/L7E